ncbi:MAG: hypothetical protein M3Y34_06115 [Actinomycetota bacterium]|nr:hypothetical protein [Actinomycetota bacterium]
MMQLALHPTPRGRDVVLEQVRAVGLALRPVALVAAVVLCIVTLTIVIEVVRGGAGIHSDSWDATSIIALLFPFAVWKREKRFGPAFLWTLPVDRRRLALAKVFAGWVWLMTALAVYILWLLAMALLPSATVLPVTLVPFTAATAMYLLGSALVLGLRHPLRCLLAIVGVLFLLYILNYYGPYGSGLSWAPATFLWLGAGLAALWAAVSRHRENR